MRTNLDLPVSLVPYAHRARVGDDEFFFYRSGRADAPPLLLLHGMGDDADTWRHLFLPLSRFFRVIAPDLPGFGRSPAGRRPTSAGSARRSRGWSARSGSGWTWLKGRRRQEVVNIRHPSGDRVLHRDHGQVRLARGCSLEGVFKRRTW
jgi:pimeloyl-ACP methyl ester carboxylesterase